MAIARRPAADARIDWRTIAARASPLSLPAGAPLPSWTRLAGAISTAGRKAANDDFFGEQTRPTFFSRRQPLPFEDLLAPIVVLARHRLRQTVEDEVYHLLSASAGSQCERWLLKRLLAAASDVLRAEWNRSRNAASGSRSPRDSVVAYRSFIQSQLAGGFSQLFSRYPVLPRLWAVQMQQWIRFVGQVLRHLHRDWKTLRAELLPSLPLKPRAEVVSEIAAGLSDPHHGGTTVLVLKFRTGGRVVYKPRSLAPDRIYFHLLDRLNSTAPNGSPHFRVAKFSGRPRARYGWMEYVASAPCRRRGGTRRFYWQIGALTSLHFLLRAVDGHDGNWIAAGEQPVCLDLETLWHPTFAGGKDVGSSVARTGILPVSGYAYPAIGGGPIQRTGLAVQCWKLINTDRMHCILRRVRIRHDAHIPRTSRQRLVTLTRKMEDAVLGGFSAMTDRLFTDPSSRSALRACIAALCSQRLAKRRRWLVRTTITYDEMLLRAREPALLRDGRRRHRLFTTLAADRRALHPRSSLEAEVSALEALDVPRISASEYRNRMLQKTCITLKASDHAMLTALRKTLRRQLRLLAEILARRK